MSKEPLETIRLTAPYGEERHEKSGEYAKVHGALENLHTMNLEQEYMPMEGWRENT